MKHDDFAKIRSDNTLEYAPDIYRGVDGYDILDPMGTLAVAHGYLPVFDKPMPDSQEGYALAWTWAEIDDQVVRVWSYEPVPEPDPDPYIARIAALEAEIEALKEAQELQTEKILALDTKIEDKIGVEPPVDPIEKEADK